MIREAILHDKEQLAVLAIKFIKESKFDKFVPIDADSLLTWINNLIVDPSSVCLVYEDDGEIKGSIAGTIFPSYYNLNYTISQELAWWVVPEYRGKIGKLLLTAFEIWSTAKGAAIISMGSLEELNPKIVDRLYKSLGYTPTEHSYLKRL